MASSSNSPSSSLPIGRWKHDVFLSFRGEDTRMNFVDHLYAALVHRGIDTFKDDEMLRRGELISPELLKAIEESRFAVVVFSENYANSSWCLDELAKIMECRDRMGQRVLPVFYHVDPSDLRGQKGKFTTGFQQNQEKYRGEMKLNNWRKSLVTASKISGWHVSKAVDIGESEVIRKIVQVILEGIQPDGNYDDLIGIEYHVSALNSLLCTEATNDVRMIGIWGMGGIGKTTIAQAVFRRIAYKFEGSCFVKDVRENSRSKSDIQLLQNQILRDVLAPHHRGTITDVDLGAEIMRKSFSNKKVFLILDDVDKVKHLEFLAASHERYGPGSRIIITTRDEHLLADAHFKYKPNCLLMDQAVKLFSRHAFRENSPPEGYEQLSYRAIHYTGCLPLALKVLGSFFRGRQANVWESALNRLVKSPDKDIFNSLKLSFDGLDDSEKNIFLDIACFFKGKDIECVTRILDSFGFDPVIGISILIQKSLIFVSNKKIGMHDLIEEMGWKIVRQSFSNSRLWEPEEIHDVLERNRVTNLSLSLSHYPYKILSFFVLFNIENRLIIVEFFVQKLEDIEAIVLPSNRSKYEAYDGEKLGFSDEAFRRMENLRLLDVDWLHISRELTFLPNRLRWLCWHHYPFSSLPVEHMRKLVGLEMFDGLIKHLWKGPKILPNMKFIDLGSLRHLTRFPDISGAPNIERCQKLKRLSSRMEMESLETLILSSCVSLERFPKVSRSMIKLSNIYLDDCIQIKKLPSSIRCLSGLRILNLIGCQKLKKIPNSVCELKDLKILHLYNCKKLKKLPEELGSMENLEELWLGFPEMWSFGTRVRKSITCRTLTSLFSLRKLDLSYRQIKKEEFPESFHSFSSLEELHLSGNSQLTQLPAGISHLSRLKLLELSKCSRLQNLHDLPSGIQALRASGCSSLAKIGDLSNEHVWLYNVWFFDCHKLLEDPENEPYINKMKEQYFLKGCAAVGHRLSIGVPGSKIPSWFEEQQLGCTVALRLPPKLHTQVIGFAICGVFHGDWIFDYPRIIFRIVNDEKVVPKSEVDLTESAATNNICNLWVTYIPFGFFQQMYHDFQPQDWSHIKGSLVMTLATTDGKKSIRCGEHIVSREDVEMIQQVKTCISDYGNMVRINGDDSDENLGYKIKVPANTYVYEEKSDKTDSNLKPLRTRTSERRDVYNISFGCTFLSGPR
ncbi:hypothetical protein OSB04_029364 [Centaurea solstitialis]|uniref:ADP-ribosyl cyclase/cyclic ADP-ribose hydrolase n=1 Tax=Centaurea solstitialis TaxID=347529 RepID=A0AA38T288_9ASTR|nr:hypothetical protein OSB04_029364 [Centaurea solstitialis]